MSTTGARRATLLISPRTMTPSAVISTPVYDTSAEGSKVSNPLPRVLLASEKARLTEAVFADRALSIWDLTILTAIACGRNHGSWTVGSPARKGVTVWVDVSSTKVISCVKLRDPLISGTFVSTATWPEISTPPLLNVSVGPEVTRRRNVTDTDPIPNGPLTVIVPLKLLIAARIASRS